MSSTVTVIIVNRNTSELLLNCLDHVFQSDLERPPQVIVVDNGSTDDSVERVFRQYPQVTVIEAGRNLGFAAANNLAARKATGEFLLLVNTDAMLERSCASKLLALMESDPTVGMAGPQLLNEDGSRQTSYEAVPTPATEILNRSLLKRLFPSRYPSKGRFLEKPEPVEALIGAVMMIRRDALEELGGFDEDYFFFLEETDLAVRMRTSGRQVMHEPGAAAVHLQGGTAGTYRAAARIEFYRSRYLFFEKHYGRRARLLLEFVTLANLTLNVVFLGAANAATLGRFKGLANTFRTRLAMWKWSLRGRPAGEGLPRT